MPGAPVEQDDDQQAQKRKGNVPVNAPGKRRIGAQPCILREEAEGDPQGRQQIHGGGNAVLTIDLVPDPPHIVEDDVKDRHGNGGDEFAYAQGDDKVFQTSGAESQSPGDQMEGVAGAKDDGHDAEQPVLFVSPALYDHGDANSDHGSQIDCIKQCFNNSLHEEASLSYLI